MQFSKVFEECFSSLCTLAPFLKKANFPIAQITILWCYKGQWYVPSSKVWAKAKMKLCYKILINIIVILFVFLNIMNNRIQIPALYIECKNVSFHRPGWKLIACSWLSLGCSGCTAFFEPFTFLTQGRETKMSRTVAISSTLSLDFSLLATFAVLLWLYNEAELTASSAQESLNDATSPRPQSPTLDVELHVEMQWGPLLFSLLWPAQGLGANWVLGPTLSGINQTLILYQAINVACSSETWHASLSPAEKNSPISRSCLFTMTQTQKYNNAVHVIFRNKLLTDFGQTIFNDDYKMRQLLFGAEDKNVFVFRLIECYFFQHCWLNVKKVQRSPLNL